MSNITIGSLPELGGLAFAALGASAMPSWLCDPSFITACTRLSKVSGSAWASARFSGMGLNLGSASGLESEQALSTKTNARTAAKEGEKKGRMVKQLLRS